MTNFPIDALEAMIDRQSLADVLEAIAAICQGKASHLACNWQDEDTAKVWESRGDSIRRIASKMRD